VLEDLRASDGLSGSAEQGADNVTASLKAAETAFGLQARALAAVKQEVASTLGKLVKGAQDAADALGHERSNLELARDSHSSERRRCAENKAMHESGIRETQVYLKSLQAECSSNVEELEEREREAELRALEDSQAVLEGRRLADHRRTRGSRGLRGGTAGPAAAKALANLSPLERAAVEMGVAFDGD